MKPPIDPGSTPSHGVDAVEKLVAGFGAYRRRLYLAIGLLTDKPATLDTLVRSSGLSRRTIEQLLDATSIDLLSEGDSFWIRPEAIAVYHQHFGFHPSPADQYPNFKVTEASAGVATEIASLVRGAPAAREHFDQVVATPNTALNRAIWLDQTYDLRRTRLLCVGDHDLTALAACLVNPNLHANVVDIDEDLLSYIDDHAGRLNLNVACYYADLRFSMPPDLTSWADVTFTDPPYTPDGIAMFAQRCIEGLADRDFGNVIISYGFGEQHPTLGFKVQQAISELGLVFEAILPKFNKYFGAQAIGSRSDLYVCRPTSRSWKILESRSHSRANIYTRGPRSLEAQEAGLSMSVQESIIENATRGGAIQLAGVVGGWRVDAAPHAHLSTLFENGLPAAWTRNSDAAVVVDLSQDPGPWLLRVLLAANVDNLVAVVPNGHSDLATQSDQEQLKLIVSSKYNLRLRRNTPNSSFALVEATRTNASDLNIGQRLQRFILHRAHGKVFNVWREGLIKESGSGPDRLTKNQARDLVERHCAKRQQPARLIDIPQHAIIDLLDDIHASAIGP